MRSSNHGLLSSISYPVSSIHILPPETEGLRFSLEMFYGRRNLENHEHRKKVRGFLIRVILSFGNDQEDAIPFFSCLTES